MSDHEDVGAFHERHGLPTSGGQAEHRMLGPEELAFRVKFLREELQEYEEACAAGDPAGAFDALLDLCYVAHGTAHLHGFPWARGWDLVQAANMAKVRCGIDHAWADGCCGEPEWRHSKRGSALDVVKPPSWRPPDVAALLKRR